MQGYLASAAARDARAVVSAPAGPPNGSSVPGQGARPRGPLGVANLRWFTDALTADQNLQTSRAKCRV